MFKTLKYSAIIFIILSSVTHTSFAASWVDNVANSFTFNSGNGHSDYTFIYDITGSGNALNVLSDPSNPFHPTIDVITDADLFLDFAFGGVTSKHVDITLDLNGTDQTELNFSVTADKNVVLNVDAIAQLNNDGTIELDLHRVDGVFELTSSTLTANGTDNTQTDQDSVPEPSTFLLLGAGLLSVGLLRERMKK